MAANLGLPAIAAEISWNGSVSPRGVKRTRAAVARVLNYLGLTELTAQPQAVHFTTGGQSYSQRTFGATAQGNSLAVLVQDVK